MTELHQQGMKSQQDILLALTADRREQNERERRESIKRDERSAEEAKERSDRFEKETNSYYKAISTVIPGCNLEPKRDV